MSTIADTLSEIIKIQKEFDSINNTDTFVKELMNFTTVLYFDYLSHAILDQSRHINLSSIEGIDKYYELFSKNSLLLEYIRINNIGQFSVIWNAYEKYLRQKYFNVFHSTEFNINKIFKNIINNSNLVNKDTLLEEFEVMRNTRNSLHDGGTYNASFLYFKGTLC